MDVYQAGLDVTYVAEHHENLHHVLVFLTVSGMRSGYNLEAEVLPTDSISSASYNTKRKLEKLYLKCGTSTSPPLDLPAHVAPGKKEVSVVGGRHYEIKLPSLDRSPLSITSTTVTSRKNLGDSDPDFLTSSSSPSSSSSSLDISTGGASLLDGTYLTSILPTSLICSSCSLPLVHATRLHSYRDLPSEHWAELVDAWMCHSDMKLHEHIQKTSKDGGMFWPEREEEALVGGSYLLVREEVVVKGNLCEVGVERKVSVF